MYTFLSSFQHFLILIYFEKYEQKLLLKFFMKIKLRAKIYIIYIY